MIVTHHASGMSASLFKNLLIIVSLFLLVLIINHSIIVLSPVFSEQPPLYLANQQITSLGDLIKVYLNPEMLYSGSIPYFRPSGHFLIYQMIAPIFGWHNLTVLFLINLFFLSLTGFVMIKLYALLFPRFISGGYIAFSLFMMHPALTLSRFMVMQFEYAYTFFSLLSMYYFILFCQRNFLTYQLRIQGNLGINVPLFELTHFSLVALSMLFYIIAITFKESAIMLGPVMAMYFLIIFYNGNSIFHFANYLWRSSQSRQIVSLLLVLFVSLSLYISLQWVTVQRPFNADIQNNIIYYLQVIVGVWDKYDFSIFDNPNSLLFTFLMRFIWCMAGLALIISLYSYSIQLLYKKSLIFLCLAALLFLILPLFFGGFPWHLSLTLLMLSLSLGFGIEFLFSKKLGQEAATIIATLLCIVLSVNVLLINKQHVLINHQSYNFLLNRNALLEPPIPANTLTEDSILIVEDSDRARDIVSNSGFQIRLTKPKYFKDNAYAIGDSYYPFENEKTLSEHQKGYFLKTQYFYNGTLFRWVYLMPNLKEMVYPFQINKMESVPDDVIYSWLQDSKNIFAVGYDENAKWHDMTLLFKTNLVKEKTRRHMTLSQFNSLPQLSVEGKELSSEIIPTPNPKLCQFACDKNKSCEASVFSIWPIFTLPLFVCELKTGVHVASAKKCNLCASYVKVGDK